FKDTGSDLLSLLVVTSCSYDSYFLSLVVIGKNIFLELVLVVGDDLVGSCHYHFSAAVVLLEFESLQVRIIFLKIQDVLNVRASESVNTLGIVANHADILEPRR